MCHSVRGVDASTGIDRRRVKKPPTPSLYICDLLYLNVGGGKNLAIHTYIQQAHLSFCAYIHEYNKHLLI